MIINGRIPIRVSHYVCRSYLSINILFVSNIRPLANVENLTVLMFDLSVLKTIDYIYYCLEV